jgi:hypothetical protein
VGVFALGSSFRRIPRGAKKFVISIDSVLIFRLPLAYQPARRVSAPGESSPLQAAGSQPRLDLGAINARLQLISLINNIPEKFRFD